MADIPQGSFVLVCGDRRSGRTTFCEELIARGGPDYQVVVFSPQRPEPIHYHGRPPEHVRRYNFNSFSADRIERHLRGRDLKLVVVDVPSNERRSVVGSFIPLADSLRARKITFILTCPISIPLLLHHHADIVLKFDYPNAVETVKDRYYVKTWWERLSLDLV